MCNTLAHMPNLQTVKLDLYCDLWRPVLNASLFKAIYCHPRLAEIIISSIMLLHVSIASIQELQSTHLLSSRAPNVIRVLDVPDFDSDNWNITKLQSLSRMGIEFSSLRIQMAAFSPKWWKSTIRGLKELTISCPNSSSGPNDANRAFESFLSRHPTLLSVKLNIHEAMDWSFWHPLPNIPAKIGPYWIVDQIQFTRKSADHPFTCTDIVISSAMEQSQHPSLMALDEAMPDLRSLDMSDYKPLETQKLTHEPWALDNLSVRSMIMCVESD